MSVRESLANLVKKILLRGYKGNKIIKASSNMQQKAIRLRDQVFDHAGGLDYDLCAAESAASVVRIKRI